MVTKYTTGQKVLIPAEIKAAREENGVIIYDVDSPNYWDGIREDQIVVDERAQDTDLSTSEAFRTLRNDLFMR